MSARRFLLRVYGLLVEAHGQETVDELLGDSADAVDEVEERRVAAFALGGEVA